MTRQLMALLCRSLCAGDVKSAITKGGGKAADSGSVMFNFMRQVRHEQAVGVSQHVVWCCAAVWLCCAVLCSVPCAVL
jgi:hypothetical protein